MAYLRRFGGFIKQNACRNGISSQLIPLMSMFNPIRCMSSTKLFIGGLSLTEVYEMLRQNIYLGVITDRDSGRARGFGFVNFDSGESASSALASMDGQELDGGNIRVSYGFGTGKHGYGGASNFGGDSGKGF